MCNYIYIPKLEVKDYTEVRYQDHGIGLGGMGWDDSRLNEMNKMTQSEGTVLSDFHPFEKHGDSTRCI